MKIIIGGIVLIASALFFGCKDDESILGRDFLDEGLVVKYDTINDIEVYPMAYPDSITIYNGASIALIGEYKDQVFGRHEARVMFDFVPFSNEVDFGENPREAKLTLQMVPIFQSNDDDTIAHHVHYGKDSVLNIKVYRLTEDTLGDVSGNYTVGDFKPTDFFSYSDQIGEGVFTLGDTMEIVLDAEVAQSFLDTSKISSDSVFRSFFNGIFITGDSEGENGVIASFNYNNLGTRLLLEFVNDSSSQLENDTLTFSFLAGSSEGDIGTHRFNHFVHHYNEGVINGYMTDNDIPLFKDSLDYIFLQALRGIDLRISGNVENAQWYGKPVVFNKAYVELVPVPDLDDTDSLVYDPPKQITIVELTRGSVEIIPDYYSEGYSAVQSYNEDSAYYRVKMTRFMHQLNQKLQSEFLLWARVTQPTITANRAVFYGSHHNNEILRPRIIIAYSEIEN